MLRPCNDNIKLAAIIVTTDHRRHTRNITEIA